MTLSMHEEGTAITRIGVISDTHGLLRPEASAALRDSDLILHAGDIGKAEVLATLRTIAPVVAVRGNVDRGPWADRLPDYELIEVGGGSIYVLHDLKDFGAGPAAAAGARVIVSGHSHKPLVEERGGAVFLNPGSAGPRRFRLPVTVARLEIEGGRARAEILYLTI